MKKNKSVVQNMLTHCLACIAVLAGCAGFTEDGNSLEASNSIDDDLSNLFDAARILRMGKMDVDEAHDSVTVSIETYGGCVEQNGSYFYDADFYFADVNRFAYRFRKDTLLLSYIDDDEIGRDSITLLLNGGTFGKLDGVWHISQCSYENDRYGCNNDVYEKYIKFDGNNVESRFTERNDFDYMRSVFIYELFLFLTTQNSIQLETVFYGTRFANGEEEYGITIQEKTNRSMKFTYGGHLFALNLDYAHYMDSVSVSLSSNGVICMGRYREMQNVPPEMCSAVNAKYLSKKKSGDLRYQKGNEIEFEDCINNILGRERKI